MSKSEEALALTLALAHISDSLRVATSCWGLVASGPERAHTPAVRGDCQGRVAAADVARRRATTSRTRAPADQDTCDVWALLERVFRASRSERRLADIALSSNVGSAPLALQGDERLLLMAFGGIMQPVLEVVRPLAPATIECSVAAENAVARIEISQTNVSVPPVILARFLNPTHHERPGRHAAATSMGAAALGWSCMPVG